MSACDDPEESVGELVSYCLHGVNVDMCVMHEHCMCLLTCMMAGHMQCICECMNASCLTLDQSQENRLPVSTVHTIGM